MSIQWRQQGIEDWHIYYGQSLFLVAEGSGWSRSFGRVIYHIARVWFWFYDSQIRNYLGTAKRPANRITSLSRIRGFLWGRERG